MTWIEYMRRFEPNITEEEADWVLWEETAYPCAPISYVKNQIRMFLTSGKLLSFIRTKDNNPKATHETVDEAGFSELVYVIKPIKPKVIDLFGLVGNTEILFEFSHTGENWIEGYLYQIYSGKGKFKYRYSLGKIQNKELLESNGGFNYIRFADRWYPHFGGEIDLPEGVMVGASLRDGTTKIVNNQDARWVYSNPRNYPKPRNYSDGDIIAYRILGAANNWVMPGDEA